MEDLDREREVADAAVDILATLDTFGFESDERVVYENLCADALRALRPSRQAGHVYRRRCSRSDLEPFGGIHPRTRNLAPGRVAHSRARSVHLFDDVIQGALIQDLRR